MEKFSPLLTVDKCYLFKMLQEISEEKGTVVDEEIISMFISISLKYLISLICKTDVRNGNLEEEEVKQLI